MDSSHKKSIKLNMNENSKKKRERERKKLKANFQMGKKYPTFYTGSM